MLRIIATRFVIPLVLFVLHSVVATASSIVGLPAGYVPGSPLSFTFRLPAINNLGAYNVDLVVESSTGLAGADFYFDVAGTTPASMSYVYPSAANFFDAANTDSSMRHRLTLSDFDLSGVNVTPGANDQVANVIIQTTATFSGTLKLSVAADSLILDTPAVTPTPVDGFEALKSEIAASGTIELNPTPEPPTVTLAIGLVALFAVGTRAAARFNRQC